MAKAKRWEYNQRYSKLRIERGECIQCGIPHGGRGQRCPECCSKMTAYVRELQQKLVAEGFCANGRHANDRLPLMQCSACAARQAARGKRTREKRKTAGHCLKCSSQTVFGRDLCFDHWCASSANNALKQWDRGPELKALWERQGGLCALTGEPLDATASVDHIVPRSRGGTHDIENLRWTHAWANYMKHNMTDAEFFGRCERILLARKP